MIDANRIGYVLQLLLTERGETDLSLVYRVIECGAGYANPAGLGKALQARRYVDAVSMNVLSFDDDIAEIDADAEKHSLLGPQGRIAFRLLLLDFDGAAQSIHHAVELNQNPVAHGLNQAAVMRGDLRFEEFVEVGVEADTRSLFVDLAQAAITDHIRNQDCCKAALHISSFRVSDPLPISYSRCRAVAITVARSGITFAGHMLSWRGRNLRGLSRVRP
jgi:hypothetical protein